MSIENFSMDQLLDGQLDDLADIAEFKPFPAGTHKVSITITQKVINKHPAFEVAMKAIETIELSNPEETPLNAGAVSSVAYMMDNEFGQGNFKKILKSLAEHYGAMPNRQLIESAQSAEVLVVTKLRPNKDKTQVYCEIVELQVC